MAATYEVISLDERKRLGQAGSVETFYLARCKTLTGTLFTVELSEAQLDPATAKEIITAKAAKLEAVKKS